MPLTIYKLCVKYNDDIAEKICAIEPAILYNRVFEILHKYKYDTQAKVIELELKGYSHGQVAKELFINYDRVLKTIENVSILLSRSYYKKILLGYDVSLEKDALENLGFKSRDLMVLQRNGVKTISDLRFALENDITRMKGVGVESAKRIKEVYERWKIES